MKDEDKRASAQPPDAAPPAPAPAPTPARNRPQFVDIEKVLESQHVPDARFKLTSWEGYKVFNCTLCPFDTMYEENFDIHWAQKHIAPQPVRQPLTATLYDGAGKIITERDK